jgi:hypothetical protein
MTTASMKHGAWLLAATLWGGGLATQASATTAAAKKPPPAPAGQMVQLGGAPNKANKARLGEAGNPSQGAIGTPAGNVSVPAKVSKKAK